MTPPLVVASLGWGVQSFTLCAMSALGDLPLLDYAIHADTGWERQYTYAFAAKWTSWLEAHDVRVVTAHNENPPTHLLASAHGHHKVMVPAFTNVNGNRGTLHRQCTGDWKLMPIRRFVQSVRGKRPVAMWLGISKDEWHRAKDSDVKYIINRYPLLAAGMTRRDCVAWLEAHGLEVPGKSACTFCPYHNRRAWEEMKRENGADWAQAVEIDAAIRDKRPPYPLYVHGAMRPLPEAVSIAEDRGMMQPELWPAEECESGYCWL